MLDNFSNLLLSSDFFFIKINVFKKVSEFETVCKDPDQDGHFVKPDLDSNCLNGFSAIKENNST